MSAKTPAPACPSCGQPMTQGFVQSTGSLAWVREPRAMLSRLQEEDVSLSRDIFGGSTFGAAICTACEVVSVDYRHRGSGRSRPGAG